MRPEQDSDPQWMKREVTWRTLESTGRVQASRALIDVISTISGFGSFAGEGGFGPHASGCISAWVWYAGWLSRRGCTNWYFVSRVVRSEITLVDY